MLLITCKLFWVTKPWRREILISSTYLNMSSTCVNTYRMGQENFEFLSSEWREECNQISQLRHKMISSEVIQLAKHASECISLPRCHIHRSFVTTTALSVARSVGKRSEYVSLFNALTHPQWSFSRHYTSITNGVPEFIFWRKWRTPLRSYWILERTDILMKGTRRP